jgi:hypothetical protein
MKTGTAQLPLHYGNAPRWLFGRMVLLSREITRAVVMEYDTEEMLRKLSNPFWFQAFGCVLGFDWHSSGVTTTVCGALKEGLKDCSQELGLFIAGGKGKASRRTPIEIAGHGEHIDTNPEELIYASRMAAKVDTSGLQDGYQIYHHTFFFTKAGSWCVVQQGMNEASRYARRYHWLSEQVDDFVCEPHTAICSQGLTRPLNLVAEESTSSRRVTAELACEPPERLVTQIKHLQELDLPRHHQVLVSDINATRLRKVFLSTYDRQPEDFTTLIGMQGVGPKTIRALALIGELIYGIQPSFHDPARFSFAHGGKDGHPYPVDRENYDQSIQLLKEAISRARLGNSERMGALRRLGQWMGR